MRSQTWMWTAGGRGGGRKDDGVGVGGRRWIGNTLMGFWVCSSLQKYLAHSELLTVQLRANDHLQ